MVKTVRRSENCERHIDAQADEQQQRRTNADDDAGNVVPVGSAHRNANN